MLYYLLQQQHRGVANLPCQSKTFTLEPRSNPDRYLEDVLRARAPAISHCVGTMFDL